MQILLSTTEKLYVYISAAMAHFIDIAVNKCIAIFIIIRLLVCV